MSTTPFNLNVFSNVASPDPRDCLAQHAVLSFFETFADPAFAVTVRVFVDPNPNPARFADWVGTIREGIGAIPAEIVQTRGLIDGFAESLVRSEAAFAMQLEHDFVFHRAQIHHGLAELIAAMQAGRTSYLKFNKRANRAKGFDYFMDPVTLAGVPLCRISGRSNNPHLIDVAYYRRVALPLLRPESGETVGLESGIDQYVGGGYVYGGLGHPQTVGHLDGRNVRLRDALRRRLFLLGRALRPAA